MDMVCLDFEGVLVPEIWVGLAERTQIDELKVTTRDIPDYDELMNYRLDVMDKNGLRLADVQAAAEALEPLPGADAFLTWLRPRYQFAIVSDTFYELAAPLVRKLGFPQILCHKLEIDNDGRISAHKLRQKDPKRGVVKGFQSMNFTVLAAGDSYNDISMLTEADFGTFFCPPDNVRADHPQFGAAMNYAELQSAFTGFGA